jgi:ABC-type phosphate/phosphonate transport system substrate-binding protein
VRVLRVASFLAENARPLYEDIARYLGDRLAMPAELLAGIPLEEQSRRLDAPAFDLAFVCGWPYTQKHDRPDPPIELLCAPVMAAPRYGARPVYFTDVIVRRDHPARAFADLRGATWSYNNTGSHSGYNVVRHRLIELGETQGYFGRIVCGGGHQGSIQLVLDGAIDAAGVDSTVLDTEVAARPELATALRTIAVIGPSPIPPVVVRRALDPARKERLRALLLGMAEDPDGRAVLAAGRVARFVPVRDADYDPIRAMARRAQAAGFLTLR